MSRRRKTENLSVPISTRIPLKLRIRVDLSLDKTGESLTAFITRAMEAQLERDNNSFSHAKEVKDG